MCHQTFFKISFSKKKLYTSTTDEIFSRQRFAIFAMFLNDLKSPQCFKKTYMGKTKKKLSQILSVEPPSLTSLTTWGARY